MCGGCCFDDGREERERETHECIFVYRGTLIKHAVRFRTKLLVASPGELCLLCAFSVVHVLTPSLRNQSRSWLAFVADAAAGAARWFCSASFVTHPSLLLPCQICQLRVSNQVVSWISPVRRIYVFVSLERPGGWMCWDVSDPEAPVFQVNAPCAHFAI